MSRFTYSFDLFEDEAHRIVGNVELEEPRLYHYDAGSSGWYRPGKFLSEGGADLDIVLYHSQAISEFIYLRNPPVDPNLLSTVGLAPEEIQSIQSLPLPGQLCLGSDRSKIIGQSMRDVFGAPPLRQTITSLTQQNLAVFPIAREGLKYQVPDAIFENYGYYCDEVVLDAHHVFDSSVPVYNRKVEMTLFKDKDLDRQQRENISLAFLADSIASGLVMKEVIERVVARFGNIRQVEVISPLTTVRGLSRIARCEGTQNARIRVHVFETLLNALPPDYYYSAHFDIPEFHIRPELEQEYRRWWGTDASGACIADTACAGYGWSEVFYSPRKQIQMMNGELKTRHDLTIADIVRRNIRK